MRGVTFPKEKFISSFSASPELCMEATKTEEGEKKNCGFWVRSLYLCPDGSRVESLGIEDNHQQFCVCTLWEMVTYKSPFKNPVFCFVNEFIYSDSIQYSSFSV